MQDARKEDGLLRGWKEIEKYVGLNKQTIMVQGYPVHGMIDKWGSGNVWARRDELLRYAMR